MNKTSSVCLISLMAPSLSFLAVAETLTEPLAQIETCARIEDAANRFACYESLGAQVLADAPAEEVPGSESASSSAVAAGAAAATVAVAADDLPADVEAADDLPEVADAANEPSAVADAVDELPADAVAADEMPAAVAADAESPAAVAAVAAAPVLSDHLGGSKYSDNKQVVPQENRGQVTSCQRDTSNSRGSNNRYYFLFSNGQVWQQTSSRRYRLDDDCNFIAIITDGTFGYQLRIEGEDEKMSVKRIR